MNMIQNILRHIKDRMLLICFVVPTILLMAFNPGERDVDKIFGRDHNVCKKLNGKVLVYLVFVETGDSSPWTDFDLNSTVDSVKIAINWLNETAKKNGKDLKINFNTQADDTMKIVKQKLGGQIVDLIDSKDGLDKIDKWSNKIIKIKTGEKNRLKLITKIRNEYNIESVAL